MAETVARWALLALLCLAPPDPAAPGALAEMPRTLSPAGAPLRKAPLTASELPARGQDPLLSLNLGLNFKIKVRSQGGFRPASPSPEPALPPADTAAPVSSAGFPTPSDGFWSELPAGEALSGPPSAPGSGWLGTGPADEPSRGPGAWGEGWDGSPAPRFRSSPRVEPEFLEPVPTAQLSPFPPGPPAARRPGPAGPPRGRSQGLEFKINIDLTAGLDQEMGAPPTDVLPARGGRGPGTRRKNPLVPGPKAGTSAIASRLGTSSLSGPTLPPAWPPERGGREERNSTRSAWDQPPDSSPSPPPVAESESGPAPGRSGSAAGSEGALAARPRCTPEKPGACGAPSPEPEAPPEPQLPPSAPLFVPLQAGWSAALAAWGPAWEAHVYGAGSLFGLLALLSLLSLAGLPFRRPAGRPLLAALDLLLLLAGAARAFPLFYDAYGQRGRLPALAARLLRDLPFPCLSSALALALLLLSGRSRRRRPALLAALALLHFSLALGAVLAADLPRPLPSLLLVSRAAFALLAALLSLALLGACRPGRAAALPPCEPKSPAPARGPFADARGWRRAARAALPAAGFGLLSAGLQAYAVLHALGCGLPPGLFGPWPWWALQLGCRLGEAGAGLPLALLGLYPLLGSPQEPCPCRWGALLPPAPSPGKGPLLPQPSQREKLGVCDTIARGDAEFLPLCGRAEEPGAAGAWETGFPGGPGSWAASVARGGGAPEGDPTADFRPPSPIDLQRSIDEALLPGSLFHAAGPPPGARGLWLGPRSPPPREGEGLGETPAGGRGPCRTSSRREGETAPPGGGGVSPDASAPHTPLSSPGTRRGSSCSGSPWQRSLDGSSQALCSSPASAAARQQQQQQLPPGPAPRGPRRSPPPPGGGPYLPLAQSSQESLAGPAPPAGGAAGLREEFVGVCQQIDTLSVGSDTIDL